MADTTNKTKNLSPAYQDYINNYAPAANGKAVGLPVFNESKPGATAKEYVRQALAGRDDVEPKNSPSNASAAPSGTNGQQFTGLVQALNTYQNDLVKRGIVAKADVYEIAFDPPALGAKKVTNPLGTDRSKTGGKSASSAKQVLDPKTDAVRKNSQNFNIQAGTQIVQVIDQVMRNSDFIREQALWQVDPVTQKLTPSAGTGTKQTVWYNITAQTTQLDYDIKRRDFAYHIKFLITPYAITQMASEYFPDSAYRGSHKSYNYWFTGQNTQILSYEQTFNHHYNLVLSGEAATTTPTMGDPRDQYSRIPMPTAEQKTGQQTGYLTNSAADNAAGYLYSPEDLKLIRMKIVGDPAFLQQEVVETGLDSASFRFNAFNRDGSINFNSGEVIFDISWNQPVDYDFETGVMNTANSATGRAKQFNLYQLTEVRSHFSRGRFEQDIDGRAYTEWKGATQAKPPAKTVRPPTKKPAFIPRDFDATQPYQSERKFVNNGYSHNPEYSGASIGPNGIYRTQPAQGSLSAIAQANNAVREAALQRGRLNDDDLVAAATPIPPYHLKRPNRRDQ
jgi:hypothetical protein